MDTRSSTSQPASGLSRRGLLLGGAGAAITLPALAVTGGSSASATAAGLDAKIRAIDAETTGNLAVAVCDGRSGRSWQYNAPMRNECASIVKVLILATVCYRAQSAGRALTATESTLAGKMIRVSDNDAATSLWRSVGGAPAVQAMARRLGMNQTTAAKAWGLTTTSAYDQMLLLNEIWWNGRVLTASYRTVISNLMGQVASAQRWGVGSVGSSQVKNGWLSYGGQWRINSVGHVSGGGRNHTLTILQRTPTMNGGTTVANRVARTIYDHLATAL